MALFDEDNISTELFQEPPDYFPPTASPHYVEHTLLSGKTLHLRLVGSSPFLSVLNRQGHCLWNGAQILSHYLQANLSSLVHGKTVLELGAGAGLPSLVAAIHGAKQIVVTDYPDADLVENLQLNIDSCSLLSNNEDRKTIVVEGYLWGADSKTLLRHLPNGSDGFDILILADLLFNHHCHEALVSTILLTLSYSEQACGLVFFTPYRPWLFDKDMAFFTLCRKRGLVVKQVLEEVMERVMFKEDKGDELLRRTVYGYEIRRAAPSWEGTETLKPAVIKGE